MTLSPLLAIVTAAAFPLLSGCARITPPPGVTPFNKVLTVTGYCQCAKCCEWKRDWLFRPVHTSGPNKGRLKRIGITASGTHVRHGTIAADGDIYGFGTVMRIEGYGYGRVEDRGRLIKGDRIDIFFPSHNAARRWGVRKINVTIWRIAPPIRPVASLTNAPAMTNPALLVPPLQ